MDRSFIPKFVSMCAIALLVSGPACGLIEPAEPDGDSMDVLKERLAGIPFEAQLALNRWAANRIAYGYTLRHGNYEIGALECTSRAEGTQWIDITGPDMLKCLILNQTMTYVDCLLWIKEGIEEENADKAYECRWAKYEDGWDPEDIPSSMDAERVTMEQLIQELLGPPPPVEIQLMLLGIAGLGGAGGILCVQSVDWACPENPLTGEPSTTSASSGAGDR
jgi:hypothetical protein